MTWNADDEQLLAELLEIDTVSPLEPGRPGRLRAAQDRYAAAAAAVGFSVVHHAPADRAFADDPLAPLAVRAAVAADDTFLDAQPNLVLAWGAGPPDRTVALNFHLDTVAGEVPVRRDGDLIYGRGAVDDKGPGVTFLAAVRSARAARPDLADRIRVLVHAVGGEEGGAMGVYGTRAVAALGHHARLTVVAEPTRGAFLDRCTAAVTLRLRVDGRGSIDDAPEHGENATVLLGFLAAWIGRRVVPAVSAAGGSTCIAGLHTGLAHNRVYGDGALLVNFAYGDPAVATEIERVVDLEVRAACEAFATEFAGNPVLATTAAASARILVVEWLKRGLPVLDNRDPEMEQLLAASGFARHDPDDPAALRPFTCDAIWLGRPGGYTVVCGPGDLVAGNAHAPDEHVAASELATYTDRLAELLVRFADRGHPAERVRDAPPDRSAARV